MTTSKKLIFTVIMFFLVVVCIEGLARLTFFIMYRQNYNASRTYNFLKHDNYGLSDKFAIWWDREIIHPYLGFAIDFNDEQKNRTTYGFTTDESPLIKREPGRLNVLILGGSVANSMEEVLKENLTRACRMPPRVVNLGLGGYKQPQQLLALTYFLSLGAEYDLIINLDGYNEIVLPFTDNYSVGVNPFYPRNWNLRINRQPSKEILATIGKVRYMRDSKEDELQVFNSSFFKWSAVFGLIKMQQFKKLNWEINRASLELIKLQQEEGKKFEETGPFVPYQDIRQLYDDAAAVWVRSSERLDQLARANGAEYYHFLQPNQYVKGSKVLTKREMAQAYSEKEKICQAAIIGYPFLIREGKKLREKNINFFDATQVFAKEKETVYIDVCCHFNQLGKDLLADYMLYKIFQNPKIRKFLKKPPPEARAAHK